MNRRHALLLLALACAGFTPAWCADDAPARAPGTEQGKGEPAQPEQDEKENKTPEEFNPSEDISADFPIDLPTDI
jgi:hypothetical protein